MFNTLNYYDQAAAYFYKTDYRHIYPGYHHHHHHQHQHHHYGLLATNYNCQKSLVNKSKKGSVAANVMSHIVKSGLYPKQTRKKKHQSKNYYNNDDLYAKYQIQKKAENSFYNLQSQKTYVEELIAGNPRLAPFYSVWLTRATEAIKEFAHIVDQPDNISFSSVYGYSKDEEIVPVYRHPILEKQLKQISKKKQHFEQLKNHLNMNQFKRVFI